MVFERTSQQSFFDTSALLFAASAAPTTVFCGPVSAMRGMPMPGGWTMSMVWMLMPGQTWLSAAASFLGMWVVMMVPMMLPSLAPVLWRQRQTICETCDQRVNWPTALAGIGYFFIWTVLGGVVFPLGVTLAGIEMNRPNLARVVPIAIGIVVVIAGTLQFSTWKTHHLACCRYPSGGKRGFPADAAAAWKYGLRLGLHCICGCAGFTAILVVLGIMDLRVMALVAVAITAERLAPNGERVARAIGIVVVGVGLLLIGKAAVGLG